MNSSKKIFFFLEKYCISVFLPQIAVVCKRKTAVCMCCHISWERVYGVAKDNLDLIILLHITDEADQRQYEEWLLHTQQLLQMQLKVLEEQIGVHRKSRKALCAKQRTAKKAGREFPEADAEKLKLVTEQQSKIQKQLDQVKCLVVIFSFDYTRKGSIFLNKINFSNLQIWA